jgi:hypothetical protein
LTPALLIFRSFSQRGIASFRDQQTWRNILVPIGIAIFSVSALVPEHDGHHFALALIFVASLFTVYVCLIQLCENEPTLGEAEAYSPLNEIRSSLYILLPQLSGALMIKVTISPTLTGGIAPILSNSILKVLHWILLYTIVRISCHNHKYSTLIWYSDATCTMGYRHYH